MSKPIGEALETLHHAYLYVGSGRSNSRIWECTARTEALTCSFVLGLILPQLKGAAITCSSDCETSSSSSGLMFQLFEIEVYSLMMIL